MDVLINPALKGNDATIVMGEAAKLVPTIGGYIYIA